MGTTTTIRISTKTLEKLNSFAKKHGLLQRFIVDILIDDIEKNETLMPYAGIRPAAPIPIRDPNWCPPPIAPTPQQ